jgi:hypothetical protein
MTCCNQNAHAWNMIIDREPWTVVKMETRDRPSWDRRTNLGCHWSAGTSTSTSSHSISLEFPELILISAALLPLILNPRGWLPSLLGVRIKTCSSFSFTVNHTTTCRSQSVFNLESHSSSARYSFPSSHWYPHISYCYLHGSHKYTRCRHYQYGW